MSGSSIVYHAHKQQTNGAQKTNNEYNKWLMDDSKMMGMDGNNGNNGTNANANGLVVVIDIYQHVRA